MDGAGTRRLGKDLLENKLMKKFLLGTVALIALGATAPALAADMAARPYTKAPAYSAPIYNWTGFYIGGHVGGAFGGGDSLGGDDGRFLGGVQGGFDYQFAPTGSSVSKPSTAGLAATTPGCSSRAACW